MNTTIETLIAAKPKIRIIAPHAESQQQKEGARLWL